MQEKEIKIIITEDQYKGLYTITANQGSQSVKQVNYYFDTPEFYMCMNSMMLRIREKMGQYILTYKIRKKKTPSGIHSTEYEEVISTEQAQNYLSGKCISLKDIYDKFGIFLPDKVMNYPEYVYLIGHMETYRAKFHDDNYRVIFELDKNIYLQKIDYEIECEYSDDSEEKYALEYLNKLGIDAQGEVHGKYRRFIDEVNHPPLKK